MLSVLTSAIVNILLERFRVGFFFTITKTYVIVNLISAYKALRLMRKKLYIVYYLITR